jgi:tetratricopeptide (TPR) repeat protein
MQRKYYDTLGVEAWSEQVPMYITSNPVIAFQYANMITSFCSDWVNAHPEDAHETFYIVEMGAGAGQFSFYLLKELLAYKRKRGLEFNFCYVMTDFTQKNIDYWRQHAAFKDYIDAGILDFSVFDLENDQYIKLQQQNVTITENSLVTPLVAIANYLFDSVLIDVFNIKNQKIEESLVDLNTSDGDSCLAGLPRDNLKLNFTNQQMPLNYYQHAILDEILNSYSSKLEDTYLQFPIAGLRCIETLSELSKGKLLLLSSDKGYVSLNELENIDPPELDFHGSFSLMVNYHAFSEYFKLRKGWAVLQQPFDSFATGVFGLGMDLSKMPALSFTVEELFEHYSPGQYYHLHDHIEDTLNQASLEVISSMLAFSRWDPSFFDSSTERISDLIEDADPDVINYLSDNISKIAENIYYYPGVHDTYFNIAVFCQEIEEYNNAIEYYKKSLQWFEESFEVFFNLGFCFFELKDYQESIVYFDKAEYYKPHSHEIKGYLSKAKSLLAS